MSFVLGDSLGTKPCVFPCKVAPAGDRRYPEDPRLKKINIDQYRSIILNTVFFNRQSLFFQYRGLMNFSILDQYRINIKINIRSISGSISGSILDHIRINIRINIRAILGLTYGVRTVSGIRRKGRSVFGLVS